MIFVIQTYSTRVFIVNAVDRVDAISKCIKNVGGRTAISNVFEVPRVEVTEIKFNPVTIASVEHV